MVSKPKAAKHIQFSGNGEGRRTHPQKYKMPVRDEPAQVSASPISSCSDRSTSLLSAGRLLQAVSDRAIKKK
jgi:hypothetical protein